MLAWKEGERFVVGGTTFQALPPGTLMDVKLRGEMC